MRGLQAVQNQAGPGQAAGSDTSDLVARAQAGDQLAFERLYRLHLPRVYALCWRLCGGDRALAEDLTQEAFVKTWQKLHLFEGRSAFGTWLHRLTANVVLSDRRIRIHRVTRETELDSDMEAVLPGQQDVWAGEARDLERAIAGLPERARTVLVLYDIEGYSHAEISALTGMAEGSSKAQLHRARALARQALER